MSALRFKIIFAIVCTVAVALGIFIVAGPRIFHNSPQHAANLTPEQVVQEYLTAVSADDPSAAEDLTLPEFLSQEKSVEDSPFGDWKISNLVVKTAQPDYSEEYAQTVTVWAEFDLPKKKETSMENGRQAWNFIVVKKTAGDRWRIADSGTN